MCLSLRRVRLSEGGLVRFFAKAGKRIGFFCISALPIPGPRPCLVGSEQVLAGVAAASHAVLVETTKVKRGNRYPFIPALFVQR